MEGKWSNNLHHLPEDIVIAILSRLPVKSLLRVKCVCKYWYGLIETPIFVSKHFHRSDDHARLLVHRYILDTKKWSFALFPDETLASEPPVHQDLDYLQMPELLSYVLGPLNGLFFLCMTCYPKGDRVALWNPATREFRPFPIPCSNLPPYFCAYNHIFGFGLDPLSYDYKVIWIRFFWDERSDSPYGPAVVSVYNLGNDSWRHLNPVLACNRSLQNSLDTTYVNGAYYWLSGDNIIDRKIVLFDMGSEVFREIQAPQPDNHKTLGNLLLHNESIALFLYEPGKTLGDIDIWVMKQEGCWTKHINVGFLQEVKRPLGFWKNDELFMETSTSQLILYDPNTHEIRDLGTQGFVGYSCLWVYSYKESLVSVKGGNKDWKVANLCETIQNFFTFPPPTAIEEL